MHSPRQCPRLAYYIREDGVRLSKARFTIAGHSAGNDEEGFSAAALQKGETIKLGDSRPFSVGLSPDLHADVREGQIRKRAWGPLQQRFLSPRILHFTKGQLYWEYIGEAHSETVTHLTIRGH